MRKFNKRKLARRTVEGMPGFLFVGNYFFSSSFQHILSGYCFERTSNGAYVWRFVYPLFDRFDSLSLLYSFRLPGPLGYIDFSADHDVDIAEEFLSKIAAYDAGAAHIHSVDDFCRYCDGHPTLARHEHVALTLGYANILLDERDRALSHLRYALTRLREPYLSDCRRVIDLAERDMENARREVLSFETEMRQKVGLPAIRY